MWVCGIMIVVISGCAYSVYCYRMLWIVQASTFHHLIARRIEIVDCAIQPSRSVSLNPTLSGEGVGMKMRTRNCPCSYKRPPVQGEDPAHASCPGTLRGP